MMKFPETLVKVNIRNYFGQKHEDYTKASLNFYPIIIHMRADMEAGATQPYESVYFCQLNFQR